MRVAVCEVLGEILVRVLCGDGLDESGRSDRDRFFDILQEHLHDTHSHVRARVLHVYTRIVNSKVCFFCFCFMILLHTFFSLINTTSAFRRCPCVGTVR